jgi:Single-strand binding protein family
MAYSINKVTLLGNVGKDPEIKTFQDGGKVASFSLATTDSWKDKATGERKSATEWHNIVVKSEGLIGIVEKYVKKGSKLHVEGKLQTRTYEKDVVVHAVLRKSGFGAGFTVTNASTGLRYLAGKQIFKTLDAAKSLADWIAVRPALAAIKSQADAEAVPREQVSALRRFTDRLLAGEP